MNDRSAASLIFLAVIGGAVFTPIMGPRVPRNEEHGNRNVGNPGMLLRRCCVCFLRLGAVTSQQYRTDTLALRESQS
jgi:hypothetical protein